MSVPTWVWIVIAVVALLVLSIALWILSILFPVVKMVVLTVIGGMKWFFYGLWLVISAPVRFIIWLVRRAKGE